MRIASAVLSGIETTSDKYKEFKATPKKSLN